MATKAERAERIRAELRDLGFGESVARDSRLRLLNRDGTFNVRRKGRPLLRSAPIYEHLITISWGRFYLAALGAYLAVNALFGGLYWLLGQDAIAGVRSGIGMQWFGQAFFFSVQTLTTVGYGSMAPEGVAANLVVSLEALVGLGGFAVLAGLVFARLSRPVADIRFSPQAVVAPYGDGRGLMFRMVNAGRGELVDTSVRVMFSWVEGEGPERRRRYETLELEREHVTFFPLHWTVVHPIEEGSPLEGFDDRRLRETHAELLIQVRSTSETYYEVVRTRTSYVPEEIVWNARFRNILETDPEHPGHIDVRRVGEIERLLAS